MGRNNRVKKNDAVDMNFLVYNFYYDWLKLIAMNVFRWEDVPKSVDVRYLELTLFERGLAVYFNDVVLGNLTLPVNLSGTFDVYGVPKNYYAFSQTAYKNTELDSTNSVLIWNNYLRNATELTVQIFAGKLAKIDRTIDVNIDAQKTPLIVNCTESQRATMQIIQNNYMTNESFIWTDSALDGRNTIQVMKTESPFVADKLEVLKHNIFNDFLSVIGVENSNNDKKERLVADEVSSNYGIVEVDRNISLNTRQLAVDKINEMFGTDIKVSFNSDVQTLVNQGMSAMGIEGGY